MSPLRRGILVGAAFGACAVVVWFVLESSGIGSPEVEIAIVVVGYLVGLVAAIRRQTRRLGLGILIGLTAPFVLLILFIAVGMAMFCCG
jgi:hypothetical protein